MDDFQKDQAYYDKQRERARAAKRLLLIEEAQENMLPFMHITNPDADDPEDSTKSAFVGTPLARLLCNIIERVDLGIDKRVAVSVGPQMGKSQVLSRGAPAWLSGRKPRRNMILGSYNDSFAMEFGGDVREIMKSQPYHSVFPAHGLRRGSEAKDLLITDAGGKMAFVGVGGSGTGKPADIFFVDDPIKNDEDAQSEVFRDKVWKWFNSVAMTRCHKDSAIIIVHTRWHQDDLIGRLCDPDHPERDKRYKGIAERWTYYNLPAVVKDETLAASLGLTLKKQEDDFIREQFGKEPMASLWEERKSLAFLAEAKQMDEQNFSSLYMGDPSPEDGDYFKKEDIVLYHNSLEIPDRLRKYAASDHAVSKKQKADWTVAGVIGVDENDEIWVLPDLVWKKMETDETVDEIIKLMKAHRPQVWWMESELISKSFGPFLKKRMHEEKIYTTLDPKSPSKDKRTRARSIQGRMKQRKVHFPAFAPWWGDAKKQLLKFDHGTNDDFVDFMAWIGLGLTQEHRASGKKKEEKAPKTGTLDWIKAASTAQQRQERIKAAARGW